MQISENVMEHALAQVFDGKTAGERLSLAEIATVWHMVGLRHADMRDAIREMVESHCLETQSHHGGLEFVLTRRGEQRFSAYHHSQVSANGSGEPWGLQVLQH